MNDLARRIETLEEDLFSPVEAQLPPTDRRGLLALHAAVAVAYGSFTYLEVGSYRGGSLQVLMRDPRCSRVLSIDPRTSETPDVRGTYTYDDNTTERMLALLGGLQDADLSKISTFETTTQALRPADLGSRPDYCFIDGEHSDAAAFADGVFCFECIEGRGVIAFHDSQLVKRGIRRFLRTCWRDITRVVPLPGSVLAVEFGPAGILNAAVIQDLVASTWHNAVWSATTGRRRSAAPFIAAWEAVPVIDKAVFSARAALGR